MESGENYDPFQPPSVDSFVGDPSGSPVSFVWLAIATILASVLLAYGTLLAEFSPSLPKPHVPLAGLSAFSIAIAVICGLAGRGHVASSAFLRAAVVFVVGWLLYLTAIHIASQSGLHRPEFWIFGSFAAASAAIAFSLTFVRNRRRKAGRPTDSKTPSATETSGV